MKRFFIVIVCISIALLFTFFALRFMLMGRFTAPTTTEFVAIAQRHQHLAQAISDYRADHGVLPRTLNDLVPEYLSSVERDWRVSFNGRDVLTIHADVPHTGIYYRFYGEEGWFVGGDFGNGPLPLPKVSSTRPVRQASEVDRSRLVEYDRRIQADMKNEGELKRSYRDKIAFLVSRNRTTEAIEVCRAAIKQLPDWWRPRMSVLYLLPGDGRAADEIAFLNWVDEKPTFMNYWLKSKYLRDQNRQADAIAALGQAAQSSLAVQDSDASWVPDAFAFDAAAYACRQAKPELTLSITEVWEKPRGAYTYHNDNLHAFRAAAYLALGNFDQANANLERVMKASKSQGLWARNLDLLAAAVNSKDQSFVYDASGNVSEWVLFEPPE